MHPFFTLAKEAALDLLYPPRCPICDGIVPHGHLVCPSCRQKLPYVKEGRCRICGKPVEPGEILCEDCKTTEHVFTEGIGVFLYDETMRRTMSFFKYKGRREYGRALGGLVLENCRDKLACWKPEAIVPVPLHPGKYAARGYNQAEEIAAEISRRTGIPLAAHAVERSGKTAAMKNLDVKERRENLSGAFRRGPEPVTVSSVLLIDDIYTTGATMDAAAAVLRAEGARKVWFLAVCIGKGFMLQY